MSYVRYVIFSSTKILKGGTPMARTAKTQQRAPLPATQKVEPKKPTISEDDVRLRAYELYLQRGTIPGDEVSDWLQAERELLAV
jgi:hypothetical protein